MNKKEIIDVIYNKGLKRDGCLMTCYSNEIFTRKEVYNTIKQYHASETAVNTTIDNLLERAFIVKVGSAATNIRYTISVTGETYLYRKFPSETYDMGSLLDSDNTNLTHPQITRKTTILCPSCKNNIVVNAPTESDTELDITCPTCEHGFTIRKKQPHLRLEANKATDKQIGGSHFKRLKIQPIEYIHKNKIPYNDGNVIKYITRHRDKNGIEDLRKAKHFLEIIAEMDYGETL